MKTFLSIMTVLIAGFVGLGLVFSNVVPIPVGLIRAAFGIGFYVVVGFVLAKWNSGWRLLGWAVAAGWGLGLDRLSMIFAGAKNVRECVLFPRDRTRMTP